MKQLLTTGGLSLLTVLAALAADPIYINDLGINAPPDVPPNIDAIGWLNRATFSIDKGEFIGREALREPTQRLVCLVLDDPRAVALGSEPVRAAGGEIVGRVTSGGFGYAVGSSIALAYVPLEYAEPGTQLAVDIFGEWIAAEVRAEPLYDPKGERVRA